MVMAPTISKTGPKVTHSLVKRKARTILFREVIYKYMIYVRVSNPNPNTF